MDQQAINCPEFNGDNASNEEKKVHQAWRRKGISLEMLLQYIGDV